MKKSAATLPTPIAIAGSSSALRVSTSSIWTDHVWQFDVTVPGTTQSEVKIDWSFTLSDGSHFTDGRWRHGAKRPKGFSGPCALIRRLATGARGTAQSSVFSRASECWSGG
jgi:hypothetical protein